MRLFIYKKNYYGKKKLIRLTEGDLHRIIENSVHKVLNELDGRTVAGYVQGRENQRYGDREYSDAMKRRAMRDYVNGKYVNDKLGTAPESPKEVADTNAKMGVNQAQMRYGVTGLDKQRAARKLSTYQNGKWGYDPSKFE